MSKAGFINPDIRECGFVWRLALIWEVIQSGLQEVWAHKLRSSLTLILLMLGVFAVVVLTSVLDGVNDQITRQLSSMGWDGTLSLEMKNPTTPEENKRFAMSNGLRFEDLPRITAPHAKVLAFIPYASRSSDILVQGRAERVFITGTSSDFFPVMNRRIAAGRALTEEDQHKRSKVAVVGSKLAEILFGGEDPIGKEANLEGNRFRIVGIYESRALFDREAYSEANGFTIPIETYIDRINVDHKLSRIIIKLKQLSDGESVSNTILERARQAHHGIEDMEISDDGQEMVQVTKRFERDMDNWRTVMLTLAGTVLLVGGVGTLSVMLISFSDRKYEIGLRKSLGASDQQIFIQFVLEALVLAMLGALLGTAASWVTCQSLGPNFPAGLPINAYGLMTACLMAVALSVAFCLYPALRARSLSPMEAMR